MGVYRGIAYDNLTVNGGTLTGVAVSGTVSGTVTGNVVATAGFIQLRTATAANIAAIGNAINTSGKAAGTIVFDTTNSKIKVATGANANSTWVDADGTTAVTPT
jgi:cell wall assembly regulator SMI1